MPKYNQVFGQFSNFNF